MKQIEVYLGANNKRITNEFDSLNYSLGFPGGFLALTAKISRDIKFDYADLALGTDIKVYAGTKLLWQGFIADEPRESEGNTIGINALGYWATLNDEKSNADQATVLVHTAIETAIANCSKISTDYTDVNASGVTIADLDANHRTIREIVEECNKYEFWNLGVFGKNLANGIKTSDGLPSLYFKTLNNATIDYRTNLVQTKLSTSGYSLEKIFNKIIVAYSGGSVERTTATGYIADHSLWDSYAPNLSINSTVLADAEAVGDAYLAEYNRLRGRGTATLNSGFVRNSNNQKVNYYEVLPGKVLRFTDLLVSEDMFTAANKLDGKSTFLVKMVDVDCVAKTARLTLDEEPPEIDKILARL